MKKFLFSVLALTLCFSFGLTAFSLEEIPEVAEPSEQVFSDENVSGTITVINEETGEETIVPLYDQWVNDTFTYGPHAVRKEALKLGEVCGTIYYKHNGEASAVITAVSSSGTYLESSVSSTYRMSIGTKNINGNTANFTVTYVALDGTHSVRRTLNFSVTKDGIASCSIS